MAAGHSQDDIAKNLGDEITQQTISNWIMQKVKPHDFAKPPESRQPFDVWQFVTSDKDAISMPPFANTPFAAPRANLEKHHA